MAPFTNRPLLIAALILLSSCTHHPRLAPFRSDGCSLFPDKDYLRGQSWCSCCVVHDVAYWQGGSDSERLAADDSLRTCVAGRTGDSALAYTIWNGVRTGGSGAMPTWYRWGYGWPYWAEAVPDSVRYRQVRERGGADVAGEAMRECGEGPEGLRRPENPPLRRALAHDRPGRDRRR